MVDLEMVTNELLTSPDESWLFFFAGDGRLSPDAPWLTIINDENLWSVIPEPSWEAGDSTIHASWSNDSQKVALRRGFYRNGDSGYSQVATFVYFLDTQEIRPLALDYMNWGDLIWSPDDEALAQVLNHPSTECDNALSIVTLDGDLIPVITNLANEFTGDAVGGE